MNLREYFFKNKIKIATFAKKIDVHPSTLTGILQGRQMSFRLAKKISQETGHEVGIQDLLPETYIAVVEEFLQKEHAKALRKLMSWSNSEID